ncbi:Leucine-rich repeat [Carpediemonas membranifera]|uniref:Leucine-rich repeat n=1 Tax=Carpediemonas membranifera TaxID=201153 RepID=A0A8J6E080_9EUKA|nr:Leucine-rich repeat [Carpediemonas membranifera]|eukprot:KAG9391421.1 Leucine-rich repeat [Carpediemonas membranifera]
MSLTANQIIGRTKVSDIGQVRNLMIWGNDLSDVSVVRRMKNVEVLSLSVNSISTLCDFSFCPKLRELYLRRNKVSELYELNYLSRLPNLKTLWLSDNPIADAPQYRLFVIANLPNLEKLDDTPIEEDERANAKASGLANSVRIPADREQPAGAGMTFEDPQTPQIERDIRHMDMAGQQAQPHVAPPPQGHAIQQNRQADLPPPDHLAHKMSARAPVSVARADSRQSVGGPPPGHVISHAPNPVRHAHERLPVDWQMPTRQESPRHAQEQGDAQDFMRQDAVLHAMVTLVPELSQTQLQMLQTMIEKKLRRDWH